MKLDNHEVLACTCRGTMDLEAGALARACGGHAQGKLAHELCGAQLERFEQALAGSERVLVTCTQEAPRFTRVHAELEATAALSFVNIREAAGWSSEAGRALPKIAALIAGATQTPLRAPRAEVTMQSGGVAVVYGRDDRAVEAAAQSENRLDLTVIITGGAELTPPRTNEFPVLRGTIGRATGHLGAFELEVNGFAEPLPSSRRVLEFGPARDGARSRCDLVIDLSGGAPLFSAHEHRDGYLRAAPDDKVAVQHVLLAATDLVGEFSKPRYVALDAAKCAHSRSQLIGCTRCLDVCPTGAISPAGEHVAIDPYVCAGCGTCAAVCPSAAVTYASPDAQGLARSLRTVLAAYFAAGGSEPPVLLIHEAEHGGGLIEMLARHGEGLPARVIPVAAEGHFGLDAFATALAFGVAELVVMVKPRDQARQDSVRREVELLRPVTEALGYGARLHMLVCGDPFDLGESLRTLPARPGPRPASYLPTGDKVALTMQALNALHEAAPTPVASAPLPAGAPIGRIKVDAAGCTLCLSCVSACPTSALRDNPDRPQLKFVEDLCIQCGLCRNTCPERVISLEPRATFGPERRTEVVLNEEEPATCISCGKAFGVKSSIDRVAAQLAGRHWMFRDKAMADRIRMCADCRLIAQARQGLDPYAGPPRPLTRTTEDYQ